MPSASISLSRLEELVNGIIVDVLYVLFKVAPKLYGHIHFSLEFALCIVVYFNGNNIYSLVFTQQKTSLQRYTNMKIKTHKARCRNSNFSLNKLSWGTSVVDKGLHCIALTKTMKLQDYV